MRKKDKLYTVNRWNRPAFMSEENLFWDGGTWGSLATKGLDISKHSDAELNNLTSLYMNDKGNNWFGISKKDNPFSKGNLKSAFGKEGLSKAAGAMGNAALGIGANLVGSIGSNLIGGGLQSDAGAAISNIGGTVAGAIGAVNPIAGAVVGVGSQLLGGLTNRMFGSKLNQENINKINESNAAINATGKAMGNASSNEDVLVNASNLDMGNDFSQSYVGSDGWFSNKAKRKYEELKRKQATARAYATHALTTGAQNADMNMDDNVMANFSAFGGPLETSDMGAIEYGFMSDFLDNKKKKTEQDNQPNNLFAGIPSTMFAIGGDLQTNGADWTTGLTHINAGGSHETNPNEGVQMGVDPEGTPNLVEEGEVIFNDYVYSDRINVADPELKSRYHVGRKKDITYANLAKKIEKESQERPNDPISQAGLKAAMAELAEAQEAQKAEMEATRAREAFEALSPEEQTAIMQQRAMEEQAMMNQMAQEEALAQQQAMQEQQMIQADGSQAMVGQEPQMQACGGKINRYDDGGKIKEKIYGILGLDTDDKFEEWAKKSGNREFVNRMLNMDWTKALEDPELLEAVAGNDQALKDALKKGYDFGLYQPEVNGTKKYTWDNKFWENTNAASKLAGKTADKYQIDKSYQGDIKELENSDKYKAFTDYMMNDASDEERMNYFKWIDQNTGHKNKYIQNGKLRDDWKQRYETARTDGLYGIQHYIPEMTEVQRGNQTQNLLWNEEKQEWSPIIGDVNPEYQSAGSYTWQDPKTGNTVNYYKAPAAPVVEKKPDEIKVEKSPEEVAPVHRAEWPRYAGLFGPAVGLGLMAAGVGKPDYSGLDAAVASAGDVSLASMKPIGNYLTYRPMDIWFEQNRLNANSRATDRAILNSGANQGSKMAGLLASGYNDQIASGDLYRKALEYNDAKRKDVAEFNRGTDQFNAEAFNRLSQFNASARNQAAQQRANIALQAAREKMDADAGWYNSLYGNIGSLFKGIGDIGTENYRMNRIAEMAARGDFGSATNSTYGFENVLKPSKKNKAKGGKVNKKKGLTY